jgi:hypothetical protein
VTGEASTTELLDRVTAFQAGMQPEALHLIEGELARRGVSPKQIADHRAQVEATVLWGPNGIAYRCRYCERPAVASQWGWHRIWGLIPVMPWNFYYCPAHCPAPEVRDDSGD